MFLLLFASSLLFYFPGVYVCVCVLIKNLVRHLHLATYRFLFRAANFSKYFSFKFVDVRGHFEQKSHETGKADSQLLI